MRGYYVAQILSDHLSRTPEGFLICQAVPIARTGFQEYQASEIGLPGDGTVQVYRDPKEVFDPDCLASFESKPVTDGHPPEWVTPANMGAYVKGHARDLRKGPEMPDGETALLADLTIMDAILISKILTEDVREISCGYDCEYVPIGEGKYAQRQIRANHIAVVKNGRAGDHVRIQDQLPKKEDTKVDKAKQPIKDYAKHIMGLGWKLFTQDAEPEAVSEALEATQKSEERADMRNKDDDRGRDDKAKDDDDKKAKDDDDRRVKDDKAKDDRVKDDDRFMKLKDALGNCKDDDDRKKAFDDWMHHATDDPVAELSTRLSSIEALLQRLVGGGEEEAVADADLIPVETLSGEEIPKNPIPGADCKLKDDDDKGKGKDDDDDKEKTADSAAIMTFMRAIKPFIAGTRDKAIIEAYNGIVKTSKVKGASATDTGGYNRFLRLAKPDAVKNQEDRLKMRATDQAGADAAWGKKITQTYLGKHPAQVEEELRKKEGK